MRYVSLFAGIGGFDLTLNRLGHECVYANDFDKYCKITYDKNFSHQFNTETQNDNGGNKPDTSRIDGNRRRTHTYDYANRGLDTTPISEVSADSIPDHDLLVGGFPCQAFSIAGKRRGFDDTRGTLFFDIARIAKEKRPKYLLLENVKGLLSHDKGRTFKTILSTLTELGYDLQTMVLNSKNFGVPQNRERVFIVGHLRGEPRPKVFPIGKDDAKDKRELGKQISYAIDSSYYKGINTGSQGGKSSFKKMKRQMITATYRHTFEGFKGYENMSPSIKSTEGSGNQILINKIRRLTPLECERLQGFPDGFTEGVSDTQRYKQLGNAVSVPVVYAIAERMFK